MCDIKLSIVICTFNGAETIGQCLETLIKQCKDNHEVEIIIIDNASTDGTSKIAAQYLSENVKYYFEEKVGLSNARNNGIKNSLGKWIAFVDDDAMVSQTWIRDVLLNLKKYIPDTMGGKILPYYIVTKPNWFDDSLETISHGEKISFLNGYKRRSGFCGSNMIFMRKIFVNYGMFNPNFGLEGNKLGIGEDVEMFYRLSEKNVTMLYDPNLIVYHIVKPFKYKFSYRFKRAKQNGIDFARLRDNNKKELLSYSIIRFFYYLLVIPVYIIRYRSIGKLLYALEKMLVHVYILLSIKGQK